MEPQELVERYLSAWNDHDIEGVLNLMHEGVAFYDAFWRENCVGHGLVQYLHDAFEEEPFYYQQIGNVIPTDHGVVFRYSAHRVHAGKIGEAAFEGAEVLTVLDDRILTVSDFYCDPDRTSLIEIAELAAKRHGESNFAKSGLSAIRSLRIRRRFSALVREGRLFQDKALTGSQLADQLDCSTDQLFQAISVESEEQLHEFLDELRARHECPAGETGARGKPGRDVFQ